MVEAIALHADLGAWTLAALAERAAFERHAVAVAAAIADRICAKVEIDVGECAGAFADFVEAVAGRQTGEPAPADFIAVCAGLVASLARHHVARYAAGGEAPPDRMTGAVLTYPDEVTALASGAALYLLRVRALTGVDPSVPLSPLIVENAAILLRHGGNQAAIRFRELLQLTTPWA